MYSGWQFHVTNFACSNVLIATFKIFMLFGSVSISNLLEGGGINGEMNNVYICVCISFKYFTKTALDQRFKMRVQ